MGFHPEQVVSTSFVLPAQGFSLEDSNGGHRQRAFFQSLEERLRELPGVENVAIADSVPPGGDPRSFPWVALVGGGNAAAAGKEGLVKWRFVTEDFLKVLGGSLKHGRHFTSEDRSSGPQALIVNEALALRRFGRSDVVGENIYCSQCMVVGVMHDMRNSGLRSPPTPEMLVLRRNVPSDFWSNQRPPLGWRAATVVVRTGQEPLRAMQELERVIRASQPGMPVISAQLQNQIDAYMEQPRFHAALLTLFALTGLCLAALGLYGLTSYLAAARTREIGVRIALGASRRDIVTMLMRNGLVSTVSGSAAGTVLTLALLVALRSSIPEIRAIDLRILPAILFLLAFAAMVGAGLPGLSASKTDPARAMRHE